MTNNTQKLLAYLRTGFGLLAAAAIITQVTYGIQHGRDIANFFSFFTIESNIIATLVLLIVGIAGFFSRKPNRKFAFVRGAATLYMVITGIVFAILLSNLSEELQLTLPWVDTVLHEVIPVVMLIDWLLFPPRFKFSYKETALWLVFPLLYVAYTLTRGPIVNWYPYPFLNPPLVGWSNVIITSIFIAFGASLVAWLLALRTRAES